MTDRPLLARLAQQCGILPSYRSIDGTDHPTRIETYMALLNAMGHRAETERAAGETLAELELERQARPLAPCRVLPEGDARLQFIPLQMPLHAGWPSRGQLRYRMQLRVEGQPPREHEGQLEMNGEALQLPLPQGQALPLGYHQLQLEISAAGRERLNEQLLTVVPARAAETRDRLGRSRAYGLWTHLYALRDGRQRGIGDLGTLQQLIEWAGQAGAAFVGLNPLHALVEPVGSLNPYAPSSRLFHNYLYLDLEAIPELAECEAARALLTTRSEALATLERANEVDAAAIAAHKRAVLERLYECFAARRRQDPLHARADAFAAYRARQGAALQRYACFTALRAHLLSTRGPAMADPRRWPTGYSAPDAAAVGEFERAHAPELELQAYLQFELDRQLAVRAQECRDQGLAIGLYQDLALGNSADGADVWTYGSLFAHGASVGAPPDPFSTQGQDWGLAPLVPARISEAGFGYFRALLRQSMAHAGALRIDHVMGLRRQYWVPEGHAATEGAYVAYPEQALLGLLALESQRHGCVVIGEDLGTVPEGMREMLVERGLLRSQVMYFERDHEGRFLPSGAYAQPALVTANTHDLPTLAGYWEGEDLERRRAAGRFADEAGFQRAVEERAQARHRLLEWLTSEGLQPTDTAFASLCIAVYALLARTPSLLLGVALDDLAAERQELNLPGVRDPAHPNWSRRIRRSLAELRADPQVQAVLAQVRLGRGL